MGVYKTPYTKFEFSNSKIDESFYTYLKNSSKQEIILAMRSFRKNEVNAYQANHKTERVCLFIGILFLIAFFCSIIILSNLENFYTNIFGPGLILIFPSLFLLSFTYSYALTLRELKIGIKRRKKNLLQAEIIAKQSITYDEFISKIILKK